MFRLAETFKQVEPGNNIAWKDKVVLGFWTVMNGSSLHVVAPTAR